MQRKKGLKTEMALGPSFKKLRGLFCGKKRTKFLGGQIHFST